MYYLFLAIGSVIVVAFASTFTVVLLALVGKLNMDKEFLRLLVYKLVLEIVAGGIFLFYAGIKLDSPPPLPDFGDESWEYRCTKYTAEPNPNDDKAHIDPKYEHGGTATIRAFRTPYGIRVNISGHRDWVREDRNDKEVIRRITPPFTWSESWGAITERNELKFTYNITLDNGVITGFANGVIKYENNAPVAIDGRFYQMPPFKALHGGMIFRRMKSTEDRAWVPKELQ